VFGSATFARLLVWQAAAHVPVTGVLDKATWVKLLGSAAPVVTPPSVTVYTPYKAVVLQQGSRGAAVVVLQRGLKVTADGDFGPKTKAAVVAFQTQQHLTANGIVTRPVWDRLEIANR
jgi:peptidoglycan hydrolase-like protein with peptidoglycan-binding domain